MKNIRKAVWLSRRQSEWFLSNSTNSLTASLQQKTEKEESKNEKQKYQYRKDRRD